MPGALAGEDRPWPPASAAVPGRSVVMLAVEVAYIAAPGRPRGQADLERGVDTLQAAQDAFVLRLSQAVPDQLEKLRRDGAGGGTVVGIAGKSYVLTGWSGAPGFHAIVPVVSDRSQVACSHMLTGFVRKFGGHDEGGDARCERRRRQATEILPAVELRQRTLADDELGGGTHHDRVGVVVEAARDAEAPGQQDGKGDLVELGRRPVRGAIHEPVLKPGAVGSLAGLQVAEGS